VVIQHGITQRRHAEQNYPNWFETTKILLYKKNHFLYIIMNHESDSTIERQAVIISIKKR